MLAAQKESSRHVFFFMVEALSRCLYGSADALLGVFSSHSPKIWHSVQAESVVEIIMDLPIIPASTFACHALTSLCAGGQAGARGLVPWGGLEATVGFAEVPAHVETQALVFGGHTSLTESPAIRIFTANGNTAKSGQVQYILGNKNTQPYGVPGNHQAWLHGSELWSAKMLTPY